MNAGTEILAWEQARERVLGLRELGFGKYGLGRDDLTDAFDPLARTLHLVASLDGRDVGCSRIVFGRVEEIPLADLTRIVELPQFQEVLLCEASHFSVPRIPESDEVKVSLWRTGLHEAIRRKAAKIVLSIRKGGLPAYRRMLFEEVGPLGEYDHEKRGNRRHYSVSLDLKGIEERFAGTGWLHRRFFGEEQPDPCGR